MEKEKEKRMWFWVGRILWRASSFVKNMEMEMMACSGKRSQSGKTFQACQSMMCKEVFGSEEASVRLLRALHRFQML